MSKPATDPHAIAPRSATRRSRLSALGAYGFEAHEPVILAALVTGDPMLLVGRSGTGKTFLLNSISEALGLSHRHYNASLIAFDDLVGFPYPNDERTAVRFLETPATIWGAESVLIDEISRCKPEHQNRLFSLVHERRVQGLPLPKLRYRWAAMNPCSTDQGAGEEYLGAEPLDPALADRFAVILEVGDWDALDDADRRRVADPAGECAIADDGGCLSRELAAWRAEFAERLPVCPPQIVDYASAVATALGGGGIRVSPRRTRLLARTLLAALVVEGIAGEPPSGDAAKRLFRLVLGASLPHLASGGRPDQDKVAAAHELAWGASALVGPKAWLSRFHLEPLLDGKARLLVAGCPDPDTGTVAVEQLLANESPARAAAFALAAFPAAAEGRLPVGAEGVNDLGRFAEPILSVSGAISWLEPIAKSNTTHPELAACDKAMSGLDPARRQRARQLFYHCMVKGIAVADPAAFEREFDRAVEVFRKAVRP